MSDQNTNTNSTHQGYCAACGTELPAEATFCPSCGVRIAHPVPAAVIAAATSDQADKSQQTAQPQPSPEPQPQPQPEPQPQPQPETQEPGVVVESASATSDSANNKSGSMPWVITGIVLVVVIGLSFGVSSCTSALVSAGIVASQNGRTNRNVTDLDDQLNQIIENNTTTKPTTDTSRDTSKSRSNVSVNDIATYEWYLFDGGITEKVSASDYDGATQDVSNFCKSLCSTDKSYNDRVVLALRSVARDESTTDAQVKEIQDCVTGAKKDIDALTVPNVSGDDAQECMDYMKEAKDDAKMRWDGISKIADDLADPSKVTRRELSSTDSEINSRTSDVSLNIFSALLWSSLL